MEMPFGMHKGKPVETLDLGYCCWLMNNCKHMWSDLRSAILGRLRGPREEHLYFIGYGSKVYLPVGLTPPPAARCTMVSRKSPPAPCVAYLVSPYNTALAFWKLRRLEDAKYAGATDLPDLDALADGLRDIQADVVLFYSDTEFWDAVREVGQCRDALPTFGSLLPEDRDSLPHFYLKRRPRTTQWFVVPDSEVAP